MDFSMCKDFIKENKFLQNMHSKINHNCKIFVLIKTMINNTLNPNNHN